MIGLVIVVVMVFIAVFAPVLAPYDPNEIHPLDAFLKPFSEGHIFGTDQFGRDLLSRVIYGARVSLIVAAGGTLVGGVIGGFTWSDRRFMGRYCRLCDHANHGWFSLLPICTVIHYSDDSTGQGLINVIIAIGIGNIPSFARVVRGEVHIVKNEEYCNACRVIGVSNTRLLFTHILPNAILRLLYMQH